MFLFLDYNEKVAVDAVVLCRMALTLDSELHSSLDTCRDLHLDGLALADQTCSATCTAWIADDLAFSTALLTGRVGHCLAEERIHHPLNLTGAVTCRTCLDV